MSLTHAAGWTMRAAAVLQVLLGSVTPRLVMTAGPNGAFPLADEEMRWQLDLLRRSGR